MANLDIRSKRASSAGVLLRPLLMLPLPDGILDQGDRQHTAATYSGIIAAAAVVVVGRGLTTLDSQTFGTTDLTAQRSLPAG